MPKLTIKRCMVTLLSPLLFKPEVARDRDLAAGVVGSLVICDLTSYSIVFQLYSYGTVVQFINLDLLPSNFIGN